MQCRLIKTEDFTAEFCSDLGYNLLKGITPTVARHDGGTEPVRIDSNGKDWAGLLTDDDWRWRHIDFFSPSVSLTYDLGEPRTIDRIVVQGFFQGEQNYCMGAWELYVSDREDTLYAPENRIAAVDDSARFVYGSGRMAADWLFRLEGCTARWFGFKTLYANATDDIVRLAYLGVYNDEYSEQCGYISRVYGSRYLRGLRVTAEGDAADGDAAFLTDGLAFDDARRVTFAGRLRLSVSAGKKPVDSLVLVGKNLAECRLFQAEDEAVLFKEPLPLRIRTDYAPHQRSVTVLFPEKPLTAQFIGIECKGNEAFVEEITAYSGARDVSVETETVVTEDFMGVGVNAIPADFMPESLERGFNEVYWAVQRRRIAAVAPHVTRLWFQLDWIVEREEDYIAGRFDFDTPKMKSVYRYLDALREADGEIELNFGWKVGTAIQEWFAFPSVKAKKNAAPRDLRLYGRACAATLRELIVNRGYTNVKYLSFYNEPTYGDHVTRGEFLNPNEDTLGYWLEMLREADRAMADNGTKGLVKYWGCEQSGNDIVPWTKAVSERAHDLMDVHAFHFYGHIFRNYRDFVETFARMKEAAGGKPFMATEFACPGLRFLSWQNNHVAYFMAAANGGCSGMLLWLLTNVQLTDPLGHLLLTEPFSFYGYLPISGMQSVNESFYELALLTRYVPNHSKTLFSRMGSEYGDCRAAAFRTPDGGYAVAVESDMSFSERRLSIRFDKKLNRRFYKYVYKRPNYRDPAAMIPPCRGVLEVDDCLRDTLPGQYALTVYTTIPPVGQIAPERAEYVLAPGESVRLEAGTVDCEGTLRWSVAASTGRPGTLDPEGLYTASPDAQKGDTVAVTVSLKEDPAVWNVALIRIIA